MKHEHSVLLVVLVVAVLTVNLCHGYAIKQPGAYTASFSKSSASASAFSHSSSSSYTFGGNLNPTDVEGLQDALKSQAEAHASAAAIAGSDTTSGATAVATAHAGAGATSSNAITGAVASSSGAESSVDALNGIEGVQTSGCSGGTSCGAGADSNTINAESGVNDGSYKKIASDKYTTNYSSGSQTNYAVSGQYVQPQSNAVVTGCVTCKGPFPGPNGSINDFKPAATHSVNGAIGGSHATSSVSTVQPVVIPSGHSTQPQLPGPTGSIHSNKPAPAPSFGQYDNQYISTGSGQSTYTTSGHVSPSLIATLPGPSGSIFDSKPASSVSGSSATAVAGASASSETHKYQVPASSPTCSGSGCGSTYQGTPSLVNIIPVLPGPSGSIYDSKPAVGGSQGSAGSSSSSTSYNSGSTGIHSNVQPTIVPVVSESGSSLTSYNSGSTSTHSNVQPVIVPVVPGSGSSSTSYNSGSTSTHSNVQPVIVPVVPVPIANPKPIFPGPTGSINSYKPASVVTTSEKASSSSSSSTSSVLNVYSGAGSVTNNPHTTQTGSKVIQNTFDANNKYDISGAYSGAGSVTNIPSTHPVVGPACSYSPGSGEKCGTPVPEVSQIDTESGSSTSNQYQSAYNGAGSVSNIPATHPVVGPVCIYAPGSEKKCDTPVLHVSQIDTESGSSTSSQFESGHVATGSVTNIPSVHTVVTPVSGISQTHQESGTVVSNQQETGTAVLTPSIHPEIPEPNTYYINKPSQPSKEIEAPLSSSPSFSGQVPCSDNNCGEIQKGSVPGGCGSGANCGGAVASASSFAQSSGNSGILYENKESDLKYSEISHDQAHLSGGFVFQNEDGTYTKNPTVSKPTYKNAETGGYAVSSNPEDNTGILIGPGTGHLPIEADKSKPFGTQGAVAGLSSSGLPFEKSDKLSGIQGTHGGSSTFSSASSQATAEHTNTGHGTLVNIEKVDGTEVTPVTQQYADKPSCLSGNCGLDKNVAISGSNSHIGTPIKLPCYGKSCGGGNTQIYIIEEKEPYPQSQYGEGHDKGYGYHYGGSGVNSGYATGQVFINQGSHTYDVTNQNGIKGSNYAGSYGGHYPSIPLNPHSGYTYGCRSGKCGGRGQLPVQFFGAPKFGHSALSGAYSSSGAYGGASAGSFASASAGATASAGSYARSY